MRTTRTLFAVAIIHFGLVGPGSAQTFGQQISTVFRTDAGLPGNSTHAIQNRQGRIVAFTEGGTAAYGETWEPLGDSSLPDPSRPVGLESERSGTVRDHVRGPQGCPQLVASFPAG